MTEEEHEEIVNLSDKVADVVREYEDSDGPSLEDLVDILRKLDKLVHTTTVDEDPGGTAST